MTDRILFWIDSDLTYFGLAYYLQKKIDAKFSGIIDITNKTKNFFNTQKLVDFENIWFYFDEIAHTKPTPDYNYLKNFEKKYDVRLWELAINERIFYRFNHFHKFTTDEILLILEHECRFFEKILNDVKPDIFITKETIQHKDELLYRMCKSLGIKILMLSQPGIGYKCIISSESRNFNSKETLNEIKNNGRTFQEMQKWLNSFSGYKQLQNLSDNFITSRSEKIKSGLQFLTSKNTNLKTHYTYYGRAKFAVLIHEIKSMIKKKIRERFIDNNLLKELKFNEKFVYFPLAVDEERNLLIGAPYYTNQIENIRHIVKSLPVDYKLYVKETPSQVTRHWRSTSSYKQMLEIPNVRLLHPSIPPSEIYKKTSLVITISGSSSLEAAFYEKPSIIFTENAHSILPSINTIKSLDDLPKAISRSLDTKVNATDLDRYITFFEDNSFEFDQHGLHTKEHDYFFFGGHLIDVDISDSKMEFFLKENKLDFDKLTNGFLNKL